MGEGVHLAALDGRDLAPAPAAVLDAVAAAGLSMPEGDRPITAAEERVVILVDSYERLSRHLTKGIERVVARLWEQELYGS